jgi:putative glutamine amidotransferase
MADRRPLIGISAHVAMVDDGEGITVRHHVANVAYAKAVRKAGGVPVLLPMIAATDAEEYIEHVDGVLITGGDDMNPGLYGATPHERTKPADRERDEFEIAIVAAARAHDRPLLCICRGIQVMNVALGGTLQQHCDHHFDLSRYNEDAHTVQVEPGSLLAKIVGAGEIGVNSLHHQAIEALAPSLRATACSNDGIVEGVELPAARFTVGVQWHPELLRHRTEHFALFEALVDASREEKRAQA